MIKKFFTFFIAVDLIIIFLCLVITNQHWLINTQVAFSSSMVIALATYYSYSKHIEKSIEQQLHIDDRDILDKQDDPYDLYSSEINEEVIENPTKEQILEAKKPIKQNYIQNLRKSFFSFASLYRIGGYICLIIGFFYLNNNKILNVYAYLVGFLIIPLTVFIISINKKVLNG